MTYRVAITGFGRIGRNILRAFYEEGKRHDFEIVAINAMGSLETNAHLLKYDTVHGRFASDVSVINVSETEKYLVVDEDKIRVYCERDPLKLPWKELGVDLVFECTGAFRTKEGCEAHLTSGAKKVLISAPGKGCDATVVYGVNQDVLTPDMTVVSNASCTTNALAPIAKPLNDNFGIVKGLMTTVHAFTNDQTVTDVYHKDLRRARAAGYSMIPTKTGAASAVGLVLPELLGKLDGYAVRVPTINVSLVDLTFEASRPTTVEEVNEVMRLASEADTCGVLGFNTEPLVSIDFNHNSHSSIFDATLTKVTDGTLVKVGAWYDNEWGFSCRMLDTALAMLRA